MYFTGEWYKFLNYDDFFSILTLEKCADPDDMQHNAAFHLGLHCFHCLPKHQYRDLLYKG